MNNKKQSNEIIKKEVKTTGHKWDGIEEYSNPDPLWIRILFYIVLFIVMFYWILYPSWPVPHNNGVLNWTSVKEVEEDLDKIKEVRSKYNEEFSKLSFEDISKNEKLMKFAVAGGKSAFHNNCAMCHGEGAQGGYGYPNLTTGAWLWGGKIEDIYTTIKVGIRGNSDETKQSAMAAFGKDKILTSDDINILTKYVLSLSASTNPNNTKEKLNIDDQTYQKAYNLFQSNCSSCHGVEGKGNYEFGAPNLADNIWLYGGTFENVKDVIYNGRAGVMPTWENRLSDSTIKQLAIYVHQLGGGE